MSSLPSWSIIDDYPETDIPDCAEIKSQAYMNQLREKHPGCSVTPATNITTNVIVDNPLICNGNVSPGYWMSTYLETYVQEFEIQCDGGSASRLLNTIGSKYFVREPIGPNEVVVRKNRGEPQCGLSAGNPINIATGNKYHRQIDSALPGGLEIVRYYNSNDPASHSFGVGWRGSFTRKIVHTWSPAHPDVAIAVVRDDGVENYWHVEDMNLVAPPDVAGQLEIAFSNGSIIGYTYALDNSSVETYDARGRLISIENDQGQTLTLSYTDSLLTAVATASGRQLNYDHDPDGRVTRVTSNDGSSWKYLYDASGNLLQLENPDGSIRTYLYENPDFPNALTGESDEKGNRIRSWAYDAGGRAILSTHGSLDSPVERNEVIYNSDGSSTTVDPLQKSTDHRFENVHGIAKFESVNDVCTACGNVTKSLSYDSNGNRDIITDFNGNISKFDYTPDNFLQRATYAVGTADEYEISYQWDPLIRKPTEVIRPGQSTAYSYNNRGQLITRTEFDLSGRASRSWTYTWFESPTLPPLLGRIQSIDGPRSDVADVTTFTYYSSDHPTNDYRSGDLQAVVNALGHRTEYLKYDRNGRPLEIRDANGTLTSITYHPRGWLQTRTTDGANTTFEHDPAGNLARIQQADGSFTTYEYDELHRLTAVADNFDNRVEYTLDAMGNRISEQTFDKTGALRHQLSRVYNQLNRLAKLIDGNDDQTEYRFDDNGNRTALLDARLNQTSFEFDSLNRLVKAIDTLAGETTLAYDARDNLIGVTDPLGNTTNYGYSGFNQQIQLSSPDSGSTSHEFDDAGNRMAIIDARGVRTDYAYDALNRLTDVSYPDSSLDVGFTYDQGVNGKGRLTGISDAAGDVEFVYDARGNLISETRTLEGIQYVTAFAYSGADRLTRITYPSGLRIEYALDATGRIETIYRSDGPEIEALASDIQYEPFGPARAFTFGNGLTWSATFDRDYEPERLQSGPGLNWLLDHDPVGNLLSIRDQNDSQNDQTFGYDDLYRLETSVGAYGTEIIEYDANGNRLRYQNDVVDDAYSYEPQSNQLESQNVWTYQRDAAGNRTARLDDRGDGQLFVYADHNRLTQASTRNSGGETIVGNYLYDGRGQRVRKIADGATVHFIYGQSGELLGEYTPGATEEQTEYVYLNGQPIAVISKKTEVYQPPGDELILDNGDPGTSSSGSWQSKSNRADYGTDYLFANKATQRSYRWTASPPGSRYQVYAWWVSGKSYSSQVNYTIAFASGETDIVTKSHKSGGGQWQLLGSYNSIDGPDYVEVSSPNNKFVADAIRWVELHEPIITTTATTHFIHSDYLGTPRRVTDETQTIVWSWDSRPFGNSLPNEDPDGDFRNLTLNLRFPGQYYDAETELHYNYFRTYDPGTGRYTSSDPLGLSDGLNTFGYAASNPVLLFDPLGLFGIGEWIDQPKFNLEGFGIDDFDLNIGSASLWGEIEVLRLYGHVSGFINVDVRCQKSDDCGHKSWEIHERIDIFYQGTADVGPNAYAATAGRALGLYGWLAANIITTGGSALTGGLDFLQKAQQKAGLEIALLYAFGPDAICLASGGG